MTAAAGGDFEFSPWFFVAFGIMLVVACTLGPLSRWHERREERQLARQKATRDDAAETVAPDGDDKPLPS